MPDVKISALSAAGALTGTEVLPLVQGGSTLRTTTQAIADLALSAVNIVSNALSNELSVRAAADNTISNAASNALSVANAASQAASVVSTAASNALSVANAASQAASVVSTAASNALSVANAASQAASIVSNALSNEISNRISHVNVVSQAVSVLSQQVSLLSQAHSALSQAVSVMSTTLSNLGSVVTVGMSQTLSVHSQQLSVHSQLLSAGVGASAFQRARGNVANVVSGTAPVDIASLSVAMGAGSRWIIEGGLMFECATSGGRAFGCSVPALAAQGSYIRMHCNSAVPTQQNAGDANAMLALSATAAGQTVIISISVATINTIMALQWEAFLAVSAAGSFQIMARGSVAGDSTSIRGGWIQGRQLI